MIRLSTNGTLILISGVSSSSTSKDFADWNTEDAYDFTTLRDVYSSNITRNTYVSTQDLTLVGSGTLGAVNLADGETLPFARKYQSGVLGPDGYIYFIPNCATDLLRINTTDDSFSVIPQTVPNTFAGTLMFMSGALDRNGVIWGIPQGYAGLLRLDVSTGVNSRQFWTQLPHGGAKWLGAVITNSGILYAAPLQSQYILKVNTNNTTFSTIDLGNTDYKYSGAVLGPNGYIYFIPGVAQNVLKLDPSNDSITEFGNLGTLGWNVFKWFGGAVAPNGCIYCAPSDATTILKINTKNDTVTQIGNYSGSGKYRGMVLGADGCMYTIPYNSTTVLKIDTATDVVTTLNVPIEANVTTEKWTSGILAPNGYIYCAPYRSEVVLKINTGGATPLDMCLSPYYNKR